jgi:hypothetical protein
MENIKNLIKEKTEKLFELRKEIDNLEIEYAKQNSKFKQGDLVVSNNIKDTIFEITGDFDYSFESDLIYAECKPVITSNKYIYMDTVYTISESQLIIEKNG